MILNEVEAPLFAFPSWCVLVSDTMPIFKEGPVHLEQDHSRLHTWVIARDGQSIAITSDETHHSALLVDAGFYAGNDPFPPLYDGGNICWAVRHGKFTILDLVAGSTIPKTLRGLVPNTPEYHEAYITMRTISAQLLANFTRVPLVAEFLDGTSETFYPEST